MYSADDIVGLILYARTRVPIKTRAEDNAVVVGYIEEGQPVGKVYAWINPAQGYRRNLWWKFIDKYDRVYYAEHRAGYYSIKQIRDQGALTKEEQLELEKEQNKTPVEKITDTAKSITKMAVRGVLIYGAMKIGLALLKE